MVGETVYIDKTGLEDAITFQEIEFEILDGYYFNEGHNNTVKTTIRHLLIFNEKRIKESKEPGTVSYKTNNE